MRERPGVDGLCWREPVTVEGESMLGCGRDAEDEEGDEEEVWDVCLWCLLLG